MALIKCPECNHDVSDSAETCPNCGYTIKKDEPFCPNISSLSTPKKIGTAKMVVGIMGSVLLGGIAFKMFFMIPFVGVILMITAIIGFAISCATRKTVQYGKCPYCKTDLQVMAGANSFHCPNCGNIGKKTDSTLQSTH